MQRTKAERRLLGGGEHSSAHHTGELGQSPLARATTQNLKLPMREPHPITSVGFLPLGFLGVQANWM
jgi:hypothetical protein